MTGFELIEKAKTEWFDGLTVLGKRFFRHRELFCSCVVFFC
jgi:hypothetical protein